MVDQKTNVTYTAVSKFTSLHKDLDLLLGKIEALEKAEKRLGDIDSKRRTEASGKNREKAEAASTNRRIKRLDEAQKKQASADRRAEKSKDDAQKRRSKRANADLDNQIRKEKRSENAKDAAQKRRAKRANAVLDSQIKADKRADKNKDAAQDRRLKKAASQLKIQNAEAEAAQRALNAQMVRDAADAGKAKSRELEAEHRRKLSQQKIEYQEQVKKDKQRAEELARSLTVARSVLDVSNDKASAGNRFTRNKVQTRNVGQVQVNYDADRDATYWEAVIRAREQELALIKRANADIDREVATRGRLVNILSKIPSAAQRSGSSLSRSFRGTNRDIRQTNTLLGNTLRNLDRIGRRRPRLIPPFIALVPIIAALLALMNPLVAGLGAVGAAALGMGASLGSLAGAALGAIPALAALLSVASALKMAFGGVGSALKAGSKSAGGGGGGGGGADEKEELTKLEKIERAQEKYRRAIEDVQLATEDLEKAKKDYLKRLKEIEKQIVRTMTAEARAIANAQLAIEEYYNVMADPGSTKGQKLDALVNVDETKEDLEDVRTELQELQDEFADMNRKGMAGDDAVRRASRALTDAIWAQRDAQLDLANAYRDTGSAAGGGGGGVDEFAEALAKLSPSAQKFVLTLLAMKDAWEEVQRTVQERFFSEFVDDVIKLTRLFPVLTLLLGNAAGAMGRIAKAAIDLVTSDKWIRDLGILAEQNVPIIENMGEGLLAIADAFMDIAVAAGPFMIAISESLKEGAKNFRDFVSAGRESGSLASWLETVRQRLSKWWDIVSNIAKTIFNYSAATAGFGEWITDGLKDVTEGWLSSSEAAREAGSSFQTYLDNIKPLLSSVKDMFAGFFQWFGRTASDPKNIAAFTEIIDSITNELGPALGRIFDTLADTGVGQSLVDALTSISDAVATFLEKGGADGIKQFFDTINEMFSIFNDIVHDMDPELVKGLAGALMTISALRFFGITKLLTVLINFLALKGLDKLWTFFTSLGKAGKSGSGGGFGSLVTNMGKFAGFIAKIAKNLGPIALAVGAVVGMVSDMGGVVSGVINGDYDLETKEGNQQLSSDITATNMKWGLPGVGLGIDLISWLFPDAGTAIDEWLTEVSDTITNFFYDLTENIATAASNIWEGIQSLPDWLSRQWDNAVVWFSTLPEQIGTAAGDVWFNIKTFGSWLSEKWEEAVVWVQSLPERIGEFAGDIWANIKTLNAWFGEKWNEAAAFVQDLPNKVGNLARDIWKNLKSLNAWFSEKWSEAVSFVQGLPGKVAATAKDIWSRLPSLLSWASKAWDNAKGFFQSLPQKAADAVGNIWSRISTSFTAQVAFRESSSGTTRWVGGGHTGYVGGQVTPSGNIQRFARGGQVNEVPGIRANSDTVPALLTPGEVIFKKAAVARAGGAANLMAFNNDRISFGEMLMNSAFSNAQRFATGGEVGTSTARRASDFVGIGSTTTIDESITIEQLIIQNPVPEETSESLPRTIRKLSYTRGR